MQCWIFCKFQSEMDQECFTLLWLSLNYIGFIGFHWIPLDSIESFGIPCWWYIMKYSFDICIHVSMYISNLYIHILIDICIYVSFYLRMGASRMDLQSCCLLLVLLFTVALAINRDKVHKTISLPSTEIRWIKPSLSLSSSTNHILAINRDKVDKTIIIIVVISKPYSFSKIPSTEWKEPASK